MISRCKDRDYLINFQTIRQKTDKKPKPTTIRKAPQSGSLELLMFHIESAHAALNFYILLVTCLTLRLVHTHLHDEGLHELEQLAVSLDGSPSDYVYPSTSDYIPATTPSPATTIVMQGECSVASSLGQC